MEMITFLLGFCIGAVAMLDAYLLMVWKELRKGRKKYERN